jgi:glycosyltransferase involved in cell wall biosynthesis
MLVSLKNQTIDPGRFEVIIVDDGSRDGTAHTCEEFKKNFPGMKYVSLAENVGSPAARNRGIRESRGNYLLFTDDDCLPEHDWIEQMNGALEGEPFVAGAVNSSSSNYFKLCHNIAQFHPFFPGRKARYVDFIAGANMGFHRTVFEDLKGFAESRKLSDDLELILRARSRGYRPYFTPEAVVLHDPDRISMREIVRYAAEHASHSILLRNEYSSLLRTPSVLRSPFLILAASPVIAMKVTAGIYLKNPALAKLFRTIPLVFTLKLAWCWGAAQGLRNHIRNRGSICPEN